MNKQALLHIQDSPYCFPVAENEMVLRIRTAKNDADRVSVIFESKYNIALKQQKSPMEKAYTNELFDWYEVRLHLKDTRLAYVFLIESGDISLYFSEDGPSKEYDFKLGYYNFFQYPYINPADIVKPVEWMKTAVFYQIFVDRFNRGNTEKDDSYINLKWGGRPTPKSFAGGDLRGITEKLDYIKELGANVIYLTPVFKSISNHKYDISDYYTVDPQFGSNSDLKELIERAHGCGIRIVLDAVFNHVSDRLPQFEDVLEKGRDSEYFDWFIVHGDKPDRQKGNYEQFATCKYMPKLNTSNPAVREFLTGIALHYINDYDIDGWRLDVSDEISQEFWRDFRRAVKGAKPDAVIIGENWHDAYRNLRGDQYDSIMNYSFTKAALDFLSFGTSDACKTAWRLNELLLRNKEGVNKMMLNLLDSHDTDRFFTQVKENRNLEKIALAMLFFYQGAPCIFYGTEVLISGGYDPDCRRCMPWDKTGPSGEYGDIFGLIRALSDFRKNELPDDGIYRYTCENEMLVMTCTTSDHCYRLIVNHTGKPRSFNGTTVNPEGFVITKDKGVLLHE